MSSKEVLKLLEENDEDEILALVGEEFISEGRGIGLGLPPFRKRLKAGQDWWDEKSEEIRLKICNSHFVRLYQESPEKFDDAVIAAAILDQISSVVLGVSPVAITALVIKKNLKKLCPKKKK